MQQLASFRSRSCVLQKKAKTRRLSSRPVKADVNSKPHCSLREFRSDDFALESRVGSIGILSISSYKPSASGFDSDSLKVNDLRVEQLGSQEAKEDNITATLWKGRIARGELGGTRVILKAYPARTEGMDGFTADTLAANELATHAALQPPSVPQECPQLAKLLGGFVSGLGGTVTEQWLVFRNDGLASAESYCAKAAQAGADGRAVGEGEFWDRFDASRPIRRRKIFILKCIREMLTGLAFMHSRNRLHQSLGPSSLILSTTEERDAYGLRCRLRDLAFAVDVSDEALMGGATLSEIWERGSVQSNADPKQSVAEALWQRARGEGAWSGPEKRAFGIADDVYAAGLLVAYMCLVPLSEPGSIDGPSIQRLFETTYQLDIESGARDFCEAEDRWATAVEFLGSGDGLGWDLLQRMMHPNWRQRPSAQECLDHPFLKGEYLG